MKKLSRRAFTKAVLATPILATFGQVANADEPKENEVGTAGNINGFYFGWTPDLPYYQSRSLTAPAEALRKLPESASIRDKMPEVYDQKRLGSCTANAVAAAVQYLRKKNNKGPEFIPSRLFIYYNGRVLEDKVPLDTGLQVRHAVKALHEFGTCPEEQWPYDSPPGDPKTRVFPDGARAATRPSQDIYSGSYEHRSLYDFGVKQDLDQLRALLANGFPFLFGFTVYKSYFDSVTGQPLTKFKKPDRAEEPTPDGHCVLAVGYDNKEQHFVCRNSWGPNVQDKGYFYMPYDIITDNTLATGFYTIEYINAVM